MAPGSGEVPSLEFTVSSALLIPQFVEQSLGTGLFARVEDTQITPLDDLKDWMRSDPWRVGELFERVGELLLGEERAAQKTAEKTGLEFDLVGFELGRMECEPDYERFDPAWAAAILQLALEEADAVQAFSRRTCGADFALAVGFQLPDPRRHPRFTKESMAMALGARGTGLFSGSGSGAKMELSGAFQLDLSAPGGGPVLARNNGVGFVQIPCADPRAGDDTIAHLSLAYPLESEAYFFLTFDALRRALAFKTIGDREI